MEGNYGSSGSGASIPIKRCEALQYDDSSVPRGTEADASDYTYGTNPTDEYSYEGELYQDSDKDRSHCFGQSEQKLKGHNFSMKFPPMFNGSETWFTFEEEVLEWCEITVTEASKRGALLKLGMHGPASIQKRELDKDLLADPIKGVSYFLDTLRPLYLKNALHIFLFRFKRFHNLLRGRQDFLDFVPRFQRYRKELTDAWIDTTNCVYTLCCIDIILWDKRWIL